MEITLPYRYQPRTYQLPLLRAWDNGAKRLVWVAHRRSGKDKTVFAQLPKKMLERKGTYFYILPTYTQAKKVIWTGADKDGFRFLDHIPQPLIKTVHDTDMRIEMKNGSILQLIGADNIDRIVGTNPVGVVFSEYSLMKPKVWEMIRPILAENGGWAVFIFTPRGMNHAHKLLIQSQSSPEWFSEILTVTDTNAIDESVLANERREMPSDLYEQEYMCRFIEGATNFFKRIDENIYETYTPSDGALYQLGVDLAKYNDFTVITPFDMGNFHALKQDRFNQMDYNLQKAKIESMHLRYNAQVALDSTGVGEPIYDDLNAKGIPVTPLHFNERSRRDLLMNLKLMLEQDRIKIPNDPILLGELRSMQYQMTPTGKTTMQVPEGIHDDCIMSLALSVWGVTEPVSAAKESDQISIYTTTYL